MDFFLLPASDLRQQEEHINVNDPCEGTHPRIASDRSVTWLGMALYNAQQQAQHS